ncbi:MAG: hypothetical protein AMJ89_01535 [candidate division Zixibacteria bacterium SM23_73]|nr:MAG: hypothetical protein AMJ89_01535 [candidate division Zixibacteria bacterium SM23_73]
MCSQDKTKDELRKEFLRYLISIKRIRNINIKIHSLATESALDYIMRKNRLKQQTTMLKVYNPGAGKGPDILLQDKKRGKIYYAEILCNDAFDKGPQKEKLIQTAKKLLENKRAKEKYLFVLFRKQVQNVKDIISKRKIKKTNLKKIKIIALFQENF